jgi:hypothetical protein
MHIQGVLAVAGVVVLFAIGRSLGDWATEWRRNRRSGSGR